ncbi:hypothetical protein BD309DRAFT_960795 [Dichomitus squalens]|nr:hypothetical protein BD309DRAFT_960795 [Dichomitus squalens]
MDTGNDRQVCILRYYFIPVTLHETRCAENKTMQSRQALRPSTTSSSAFLTNLLPLPSALVVVAHPPLRLRPLRLRPLRLLIYDTLRIFSEPPSLTSPAPRARLMEKSRIDWSSMSEGWVVMMVLTYEEAHTLLRLESMRTAPHRTHSIPTPSSGPVRTFPISYDLWLLPANAIFCHRFRAVAMTARRLSTLDFMHR